MNTQTTLYGVLGLAAASALILSAAADDATTPAQERVPFPADYATSFTVLRMANKPKPGLFATIYGNEPAANVRDTAGLPYPDGSVFVMEWAQPLKDERGEPLPDRDGLWRKGTVVRVDVMRRDAGYGEGYGEARSGTWEFATYGPDGSLRIAPADAGSCADCHQKAGAARDFVFRGRFQPPADGGPAMD